MLVEGGGDRTFDFDGRWGRVGCFDVICQVVVYIAGHVGGNDGV